VHALDYNDQIIRVGAGIKMNLFLHVRQARPKVLGPRLKVRHVYGRPHLESQRRGPRENQELALRHRELGMGSVNAKTALARGRRKQSRQGIRHGTRARTGAIDRPFKEGGSMVLEVSDKSVENTCALYAIRAAIPPGPLSDEIQKVQKGWIKAGKEPTHKTCTRASQQSTHSPTLSRASQSSPSGVTRSCKPLPKTGQKSRRRIGTGCPWRLPHRPHMCSTGSTPRAIKSSSPTQPGPRFTQRSAFALQCSRRRGLHRHLHRHTRRLRCTR
jgi:hypothetical protein